MERIEYADGYKYQLRATYGVDVGIIPAAPVHTEYINLDERGHLTVCEGYAWDGPSGPTIDTSSFMRGSLVHDALYQLMREGHLPESARQAADQVLRRIVLEDGMWPIRAWWVYAGVRFGGEPSADPANISPDRFAPA